MTWQGHVAAAGTRTPAGCQRPGWHSSSTYQLASRPDERFTVDSQHTCSQASPQHKLAAATELPAHACKGLWGQWTHPSALITMGTSWLRMYCRASSAWAAVKVAHAAVGMPYFSHRPCMQP